MLLESGMPLDCTIVADCDHGTVEVRLLLQMRVLDTLVHLEIGVVCRRKDGGQHGAGCQTWSRHQGSDHW